VSGWAEDHHAHAVRGARLVRVEVFVDDGKRRPQPMPLLLYGVLARTCIVAGPRCTTARGLALLERSHGAAAWIVHGSHLWCRHMEAEHYD
jgi:hypothetical protein